jgi:hypothetical protein
MVSNEDGWGVGNDCESRSHSQPSPSFPLRHRCSPTSKIVWVCPMPRRVCTPTQIFCRLSCESVGEGAVFVPPSFKFELTKHIPRTLGLLTNLLLHHTTVHWEENGCLFCLIINGQSHFKVSIQN